MSDTIEFQAIDWHGYDVDVNANAEEDDDDVDENEEGFKKKPKKYEYVIKVFGRTLDGTTVSLNVTGFTPYFFLKVVGSQAKSSVGNNIAYIKQRLDSTLPWWAKKELLSVKEVKRKEYWGFTNNEIRSFLKIQFTTYKAMRASIRLIEDNNLGVHVKLYESNIEPLLRFLHYKKIQPCGWVTVPKVALRGDTYVLPTDSKIKLSSDYMQVNPYVSDRMAPFVIASFDIECTSSHGDFPQAKKGYKRTAGELVSMMDNYSKTMSPSQVRDAIKEAMLCAFDVNDKYAEDEGHEYVSNLYFKKRPEKDALKQLAYRCVDDVYHITNKRLRLPQFVSSENGNADPVDAFRRLFKQPRKDSTTHVSKGVEKDETGDAEDTEDVDEDESITSKLSRYFDDSKDVDGNRIFPAVRGDPIIQIGTTLHRYGERTICKKHILTLGTCDPIEGVIVEECKTERELLCRWIDFMKQEDPDIITGYNILGFDMKYMYDRADELGRQVLDKVCSLGRIHGYPIMYNGKKPQLCVKKLQSSALGDNLLISLPMDGRIPIDMMKDVQRNYKLEMYKLDFVASSFIKGKILRVMDERTLEVDNVTGMNPGNFIYLGEHKYEVERVNGGVITLTTYAEMTPEMVSKPPATWGLAKDDVTPAEIFECQHGTSTDRAKIAKYCVMDCALCNFLMMKLEVMANNIGMCNVCIVPLAFIFMRGQGIKIFSLLAKYCKEENFLIPTINKGVQTIMGVDVENLDENIGANDGGYEGAIVLTPQPGVYIDDPVAVLDYSSLYPSSMISENISHDSIILDPKYDNLTGLSYLNIEYDVTDSSGNKSIQTDRYVQLPNGEKSVLPRILQALLTQRSSTRKKIMFKTVTMKDGTQHVGLYNDRGAEESIGVLTTEKKETVLLRKEEIEDIQDTFNEFQKAILDGLQLAFKVTANSLYGSLGAKNSAVYMKSLAASTTATGRSLILKAKDYIENEFGGKVVYGDSVVGDTPTVLRQGGEVRVCTFENVVPATATWEACTNVITKETCELNDTFVLTSEGWVKVHRIIRHKLAPHKKIVRVSTRYGSVDVTDDHSLFTLKGDKVSPKDLQIGCEILHIRPDKLMMYTADAFAPPTSDDTVRRQEAYVMGFFSNFGSIDHGWHIRHLNGAVIKNLETICKAVYGNNFQVSYYGEKGYVLRQYISVGLGSAYKNMFFDENRRKVVPSFILNGDPLIKDAFLKGMCESVADSEGVVRLVMPNNEYAQGIYYVASSIGVYVEFGTKNPTEITIFPDNIALLHVQAHSCSSDAFGNWNWSGNGMQAVMAMHEIPYDGYVYDFTTANHKFIAGTGGIIASNTDSVFCTFNKEMYKGDVKTMSPTEKVGQTITLAQEAEKGFQKYLKPPHVLEYEKTAYPFVIFAKKRYVYNKYEFDPKKFKQVSMGIELKRRDNANIVKIVYGGVIDIILNELNIEKSVEFLTTSLQDMLDGKYSLEELIITKALRAEYSMAPAHKVLADRMRERDPGSAPNINDRIPFAYVIRELDRKKRLAQGQGERIEHPEYIRKHNLKVDYEFYITNQIMNPCLKLYALPGVLERIRKRSPSNPNILRAREAKEILFDPILMEIERKDKKQRTITEFCTPNK